nr:putative reverse transcriptase domain-containing protein [Tanacetum cinerariifolium]
MAALQYKAKHNKVGYLLKPTGSDDYHNIIDFLSSSHIRYALTANPIIFDSLVKQFWSAATLKAPELGQPTILATTDRTPYIITGDLVRSSLQLADDGGVTDLPIPEIYSGMVALGYVSEGNAKKFLMYPRFLQIILGIETSVTRQYKVLVFSSKLFDNMRLNFAGNPMPLLPAMLLQAEEGEGAEHDHSSAQPETAAGSFFTREDAPLRGDFHTSTPRSSHTPHAGQPLGGAEDPITLTTLSSVVSTLVQKVHSLEAELHDHKKLFKDVIGKLVKKVKTLEVKLKIKKRKLVVSDSDDEDDTTPNVDLDSLRALANAAVAVDSDVPPGSTYQITTASPCAPTDVPAATSTTPTGAFRVTAGATGVAPGGFGVAAGATGVAPGDTGVAPGASGVASGDSNISPGVFVAPTATSAVPVDSTNIPTVVPAVRLNVLAGASNKGKYVMIKEDIPVPARTFRQMEEDRLGEEAARRLHEEEMAKIERERVEANASLSKTLLGDDVSEDNFPARMAALIRKKRQDLAEQLFKERQNRPLTLAQQKAYMRQHVKNQSSAIYNTDVSKVVVDEDSDDEDSVDKVWSAVVGWEILSIPLGDINALYRIDGSTKHFTSLRQILHLVDRQDLMKLYGFVEIHSWRLYTLSNVHVLETVFGEVLSMFTDVFYPLSVELMKKMLLHKLEIDSDFVDNDLTTAEQYVVLTGRVIVPAGRYIVPTGSVIVATRWYIVPAGKLNSRYVGLFKVLAKVGVIAYKLELPQELSRVHNTFHVSNLKKCSSDEPLAISLNGIHIDDKLYSVEEPIEIMDREVKWLKQSHILIVKVRWNSRRGLDFIWEREDQFRKKYPRLFTKTAPSSSAAS